MTTVRQILDEYLATKGTTLAKVLLAEAIDYGVDVTISEALDMAIAVAALIDNGCDCEDDEPEICLSCMCAGALAAERAERELAEARLARTDALVRIYAKMILFDEGDAPCEELGIGERDG